MCSLICGQEILTLQPESKKELEDQKNSAALVIECNVPSAQVYLNSVYQGTTKLRINQLLPGEYILQVEKAGFESKRFYVTAKKGYILSYKVELKKEEQISE